MKKSLTLWVPLTLAVLVGCNGSTGTSDTLTDNSERNPNQWPQHPSPLSQPKAYEQEVDALLARMSLEEKVGQMIQPELRNVTPEDVKEYHLGSILNGGGSFP